MLLVVGDFLLDECPACSATTRCEIVERHPDGTVKKWKPNPVHSEWHRQQRWRWILVIAFGLGILLGLLLAVLANWP